MSKYSGLTEHLKSHSLPRVPMSFGEIERVLGFKLPTSSRSHRAFWSNNPTNNVMTRAWLNAGYRSEQVDLENQKVVFTREQEAEPKKPVRKGPHPAFGALKGTTIVMPGVDLTEPADPEWAKVYDD